MANQKFTIVEAPSCNTRNEIYKAKKVFKKMLLAGALSGVVSPTIQIVFTDNNGIVKANYMNENGEKIGTIVI